MKRNLINRILISIKGFILSFFRNNPKNGYYLFLDDLRMPDHVFKYTGDSDYARFNWMIVRNYNEFIKTINKKGMPQLISFDNDLGIEHTRYFFDNGGYANPPDPLKGNFTEKTGYDCAKWLAEFCMDNKIKLPKYKVHSKNPVGRENIIKYLGNYIKHCE